MVICFAFSLSFRQYFLGFLCHTQPFFSQFCLRGSSRVKERVLMSNIQQVVLPQEIDASLNNLCNELNELSDLISLLASVAEDISGLPECNSRESYEDLH